jgi:hypothetical protein
VVRLLDRHVAEQHAQRRTTHLKENYMRRNGIPRSANATFTEHWMRHGNYLTVTTVITDPAFLTEPLVRSQTWVLDPGQRMGRDICEYGDEVPRERKDYVPESPARHQSVPPRSGRLVRAAVRSHARRRGDALSRVPLEDAEAGEAEAGVRALLQLRCRHECRLPAGAEPAATSRQR